MQAKFAFDGSISSSSQFFRLPQLPLEMTFDIKMFKIDSEIIILLPYHDLNKWNRLYLSLSLCVTVTDAHVRTQTYTHSQSHSHCLFETKELILRSNLASNDPTNFADDRLRLWQDWIGGSEDRTHFKWNNLWWEKGKRFNTSRYMNFSLITYLVFGCLYSDQQSQSQYVALGGAQNEQRYYRITIKNYFYLRLRPMIRWISLYNSLQCHKPCCSRFPLFNFILFRTAVRNQFFHFINQKW
jgi:hypothetical protein